VKDKPDDGVVQVAKVSHLLIQKDTEENNHEVGCEISCRTESVILVHIGIEGSQAQPAELVLAFPALNVLTTAILLD
jgi:hypothetical protein